MLRRYFKTKYGESALVKATVDSKYPDLLNIPVELPPLTYVCGGASYIQARYVEALSRMEDLFAPFPVDNDTLLKFYSTEKHMFVGLPAFQDRNCSLGMLRLGVTATPVKSTKQFFQW